MLRSFSSKKKIAKSDDICSSETLYSNLPKSDTLKKDLMKLRRKYQFQAYADKIIIPQGDINCNYYEQMPGKNRDIFTRARKT